MSDFNGASWPASDLLTDVLRAARLPDTGTIDYTPTVVLRMATDSIWNWATHQLSTARDGRMAQAFQRDMATASLSSTTSVFELPPMGVADAIDGVTWISADGGQQCRLQVIPANMLPIFTQPNDAGSPPTGYALMEGTIRVFPKCGAGTLQIVYQRRHGQLVVGSDTCIALNALDVGGLTSLNLSVVPSSFVAGAWVDVIGSTYPYRTKIAGARITLVSSFSIDLDVSFSTFTAATDSGDTVVLYGKTPYVSLPLEMRASLTQHIAANIMAELGDTAMVGMYDQRADMGAQRTRDMLSPRTKADMPKLFNPYSLARRGGGRGGRRWRSDRF